MKNILRSPKLPNRQPPVQWVIRSLCLELKRLGRETEHLPPPNANINYNFLCVIHGVPFYRNAAYLYAVLKYGISIKNFASYLNADFKVVTFGEISLVIISTFMPSSGVLLSV